MTKKVKQNKLFYEKKLFLFLSISKYNVLMHYIISIVLGILFY